MTNSTVENIRRAAAILFRSGAVVEVRVPNAGRQRTISGYFQDLDKLAAAVAQLEHGKHPGVYWTLNPVDPALIARADHRVKAEAKHTSADENVVARCWLFIDLDPKRPADISSTEAEHQAALKRMVRIHAALCAEGWPEGVRADSGNGAHLLYAIDLPNDAESAALVRQCLEALAQRFDGADGEEAPRVEVDRTTYNASRIFKAWGTTARKGDSTNIRPHRLSTLLDAPDVPQVVPLELLRRLAGEVEAAKPKANLRPGPTVRFDLGEFLGRHGVRHRDPVSYNGGRKYVLEACPFNAEHRAPDAMVAEYPDGYAFKCLHNSCAHLHWQDFRDLFEPNRPRFVGGRREETPAPGATPLELPCDVEAGCDARAELPLSVGDVEAAVDAAIQAGDLPAAMRLVDVVASTPLQTQALLTAKLRVRFKRDFSARDWARALRASEDERARKMAPVVVEDDHPPEDAPDLLCFPLTDSGNGERLVALCGEDLRFCSEFKKWMWWDGKRWLVDTDAGLVTQRVKSMARLLYMQAGLLDDPDRRRALQHFARESENQGAISAALLRTRSEPGMQISAGDMDKHRYLLNCLNGVVDVRSGELLPFDRRYYITKMCHVKYRPEAMAYDCPRFLKFLHWAMGETEDMAELPERVTRMVGFLQKAFGYALTGDVSEKAAFIFYGTKGNNGKTMLLTVFKTLLAEYATQLDINTLMTSKFTDNNVRADLAKLHGARFVITSEVDDGQRLSERLMKYLTAGMGEMTACRKFENPFEFFATHKIFMDCNYRPEIRGADEAIWSRLKCVPFLHRIEKTDVNFDGSLIEKIMAESEGILAWTVRGGMLWAKEGLGDPAEVQDAVARWRDDDDPLKGFFEECCELDLNDANCYCRCRDFTAAYQAWCKENNEPQIKSNRLTQRLELKGISLNRSRRIGDAKTQVRCWDGVRLRQDVTGPMAASSGRLLEDRVF